ncbi:MAG TPA: hypothetical protein VF482_23115 [Trebonia sp.]
MGPQDRGRAAKIAGVAGITLLVAACGSSSSSPKSSVAVHSSHSPSAGTRSGNASTSTTPAKGTSSTAILKAEHTTTAGTVLATSQGFTLYGFTRDSSTASACTGACAKTWHPLTGTPRVAPGTSLPGTLGTITRSGGVKQATFDGHPLYTFKDDTAPGQAKGNGDVEFGGKWLAIPVVAIPVSPSKSAVPSISAGPSKSAAPSKSAHTRTGGGGP